MKGCAVEEKAISIQLDMKNRQFTVTDVDELALDIVHLLQTSFATEPLVQTV
jgi:hypothetical protein